MSKFTKIGLKTLEIGLFWTIDKKVMSFIHFSIVTQVKNKFLNVHISNTRCGI